MIIAAQKKKENIAEYLLYMYQIEDLIRANEFDIDRIEQTIISQFDAEYSIKREMREWYKDLIERLISEGKQKVGHIAFLEDIVKDLNELNLKLLHDPLNSEFKDAYDKAKLNVEALRMRSGHGTESDVHLALNGLYGYLILRLQKKEISKETADAFARISEWIALLSQAYK
ncbi:DUF4924 family protein [Bacteroidota bacterium]